MSKAQSQAAWLMVAAVSVAGCEHAMVGNATALSHAWQSHLKAVREETKKAA